MINPFDNVRVIGFVIIGLVLLLTVVIPEISPVDTPEKVLDRFNQNVDRAYELIEEQKRLKLQEQQDESTNQ